jgi:hypothetical protein
VLQNRARSIADTHVKNLNTPGRKPAACNAYLFVLGRTINTDDIHRSSISDVTVGRWILYDDH